MSSPFWDAECIHEEVCPLFGGNRKTDVWVILHKRGRISRVVRRQPRIAVRHLIKDLVHHIRLHQRLLLFQQHGRLLPLALVRGVKGVSQQFLRNAKGIPRVVKHQNLSCILFLPQDLPAVDLFFHIVLIIENSHDTPSVRHGIFVGRVVIGIAVLLVNVLEVGDVIEVQLL